MERFDFGRSFSALRHSSSTTAKHWAPRIRNKDRTEVKRKAKAKPQTKNHYLTKEPRSAKRRSEQKNQNRKIRTETKQQRQQTATATGKKKPKKTKQKKQNKSRERKRKQAAEVKGRLDTDCFVFAVRKDRKKFKRVKELLDANVHSKNCTKFKFTDDAAGFYHPTFPAPPQLSGSSARVP